MRYITEILQNVLYIIKTFLLKIASHFLFLEKLRNTKNFNPKIIQFTPKMKETMHKKCKTKNEEVNISNFSNVLNFSSNNYNDN